MSATYEGFYLGFLLKEESGINLILRCIILVLS